MEELNKMKADVKKPALIRCPRCELNFINKKDKHCAICKQEMKAISANHASNVDDMELCPICRTNLIHPEQIMCNTCAKERRYEESEVAEFIRDDWDDYANQNEDEEVIDEEDELEEGMSLTELDDEDLDAVLLPDAEELDVELEEEEAEEDLEEDFDDAEDFDDVDEDAEDEDDLQDDEE